MRQHIVPIAVVIGAILFAVSAWMLTQPDQARVDQPPATGLADQKLIQEIRQLELENDQLASRWHRLLEFAPFGTVVVAIIGAIITIQKQMSDNRRQREEDRRQREREDLRRFDTQFTSVVQNLGCDSTALQISAAASLLTFLKPRYDDVLDDVFIVLIANLKVEREPVVGDVLRQVFERAIRLKLARKERDGCGFDLDLARTRLYRVDLEKLDFRGVSVDVAYADLSNANLTNAKIPRLQGIEVTLEGARVSRSNLQEARLNSAHCRQAKFHSANLVSATFKQADLRQVEFHQASLQSAHLEGADLTDADFTGADLNDTFFRGATFNGRSLRSITRARNWGKGHFDQDVMEQLQTIAASDSAATPTPTSTS